MFCENEKKVLLRVLQSLKEQKIISDDSKSSDYIMHTEKIVMNLAKKINIDKFSENKDREILEKTIVFSCLYMMNLTGCLNSISSNDRGYEKINDMFIQVVNQIKASIILENNNLYSSQILVNRNIFELLWLIIVLLTDSSLSDIYFDSSMSEYSKWKNHFTPSKLRKMVLEVFKSEKKSTNDILNKAFKEKRKKYKELSAYAHNDYSTFKENIYYNDIPIFLTDNKICSSDTEYLSDLVEELISFFVAIEVTVMNRKKNTFVDVVPEMIYQTICRDYLLGYGLPECFKISDKDD